MFDGFWSGMIGGLFGPAATRFLRRFKYTSIFGIIFVGTIISFLAFSIYEIGGQETVQRILSRRIFAIPIVGLIIGAVVTFSVWFSSVMGPGGTRKDISKENNAIEKVPGKKF